MIQPLTSLRFFFAFMVFLSHMDYSSVEKDSLGKPFNLFYFGEGYIGVSFFFILSGFILAYNYKQKLLHHIVTIKEFWISRFARIYPLHLLTLLLAIPLTIQFMFTTSRLYGILKIVFNILLLQSFIPNADFYFSLNALSWSLSCEFFFYLMFPFLIIFLFTKKAGLLAALVSIILIPVGIYFCNDTWLHPVFYINPLSRLVDFVIGILLFELFEKNFLRNIYIHPTSATLMEVSSIFVFIIFIYFKDFIPQGYRFSCYYWFPMVFIIYSFSRQNGLLSALLSKKIFVVLGEISFGFYLIHLLCIKYILIIHSKFPFIQNNYLLATFILATAIMASYFSYIIIEKPANRFTKKILLNKPVLISR